MLLVHLVMGDKKLVELRRALLPGAAVFVALNVLIGATSPEIDNAAHIGGFVLGVFLGFVFFLPWAARRQSPARVANGQPP